MIRLNRICQIGIDVHQFHDHFQKTDVNTPDTFSSIYGGEERLREKLMIEPNARILPKTERAPQIFNTYSSIMLVPDRIWVDTAHVILYYQLYQFFLIFSMR